MKKRIILLGLFLIQILFFLEAQPLNEGNKFPQKASANIVLMGKVIDADSDLPLEYATVSLFNPTDKTLIDGTITDEKGHFKLDIKPGDYYATIEFLAYQTQTIENISATRGKNINLGIITLATEASALEEVLVTAEKSQMIMTLDKKVFNVGKDLSARGGNAADLLDNVPSVQVDVEGNISLRGNESVRILVDGKPSGLVSSANGLRNLQANMIDRVEVITNPSARYEAEGTAGIINIILKKNRAKGLNGSFDFNIGYPDNYGIAFNLNYRTKKFNFFTNYGVRYRKGPGESSLHQEVIRNDSIFITDQKSDRRRGGLSNNFRFGADYYFNTKNILTTALSYRISDDDNFATTTYNDYLYLPNMGTTLNLPFGTSIATPIGITTRTDDEREDESKLEYALTYRRTFEQKDREFTMDVRYQDNVEEEGSDLVNRFFTPELTPNGIPDLFQESNNKEQERQLIVQTDYVHPFNKESKFEAGLRASFRNINNDYLVEELADGKWESLEGLSNIFDYDEHIYAAYLSYGNKLGKFSFLVGERLEYSRVSTHLITTNQLNDRDYLSPITTVHLTYDLPKDNAVQLSYSQRIRRPRFWDLNPFFTFSDNRNFFSGNPDLDPEFTHSMELGHIKHWEKGSLNSAAYYRYTTGKIQRIRRLDEEKGTFVTQPENLSTENAFGFEFNASYNPFKWWRLNGDFNFFRAIVDGTNLGASFESDTYSWFVRGSSRFKIKKKTDLQIRYNYRAPLLTTQGKRKSIYTIDLAASRDILKDKATLTLSIRDLFNSRRRRYISEGELFYSEGDFQWRARQAILTLNYRLNQKKQRARQRGRGEFEGGEDLGF